MVVYCGGINIMFIFIYINTAEHTGGVNRHSDNGKLPSRPMESQLLLQPCSNQQTVQIFNGSFHAWWELQIQLKC